MIYGADYVVEQMYEQRMCYGARNGGSVVQLLVEGVPKPGAMCTTGPQPFADADFDVVVHRVPDVDMTEAVEWRAKLNAVVNALMPFAVINVRGACAHPSCCVAKLKLRDQKRSPKAAGDWRRCSDACTARDCSERRRPSNW